MPDEVASITVYLASPRNGYATTMARGGHDIVVMTPQGLDRDVEVFRSPCGTSQFKADTATGSCSPHASTVSHGDPEKGRWF